MKNMMISFNSSKSIHLTSQNVYLIPTKNKFTVETKHVYNQLCKQLCLHIKPIHMYHKTHVLASYRLKVSSKTHYHQPGPFMNMEKEEK